MKRIGEILAETCDVTQEVISQALRLQSGNGLRLGEILVGQHFITEPDLQKALSMQSGMELSWLEQRCAWLAPLPMWIRACLCGAAAIAGIWFLSSLLLNLAKVFS